MPPEPARQWTTEQFDAIRTIDTSLLVSAAAGSGKTAVLSERCAHLVCDAPDPCDIDELLVVTFTEAAAAEMKSRIQQALRNRLATAESPRLLRQLALADHAQVSTLHGFCARILRQHFHVLELDPGFAILDGDEAALLRGEIARELFLDRYDKDDSGAFQQFIDAYGNGRDEGLIEQVIHTHGVLCSVVDPAGWMDRARRRIADAVEGDLDSSDLGRELRQLIHTKLEALRARCDEAIRAISAMDGFAKYVDYLHGLLEWIDLWRDTLVKQGTNDLAPLVESAKLPRLPSLPSDTPGKDLATGYIESVRKEMKKEGALARILRFTTHEWQEGLRAIRPHVGIFLDLIGEFTIRYAAAKQAARSIDFADLERLAFDVLRDPASPTLAPSEVASLYQKQYRHVLVDEYQDINELQDAILTLVSRESASGRPRPATNLFCVGDVKQSIYRFRLADPEQFIRRETRFRDDPAAARGKVINLSRNFRSRAPLLDVLNQVFLRLMTRDAADIEYDHNHHLVPGAPYPASTDPTCFTGAPVELHLLAKNADSTASEANRNDPASRTSEEGDADNDADDDEIDLDQTEREASFIVHRIRQLMGADGRPPMQVMDRASDGSFQPRRLRHGDIVILLRSLKFKGRQYVDILRRSGIPVHSESGSGFFESMEISDILALLNVLDNARQDIHLAAILRSPLVGLADPEDSLARIRLAYGGYGPFHLAVTRYASHQRDELAARLSDFLDDLNRWREMARERPLADLIWTIYNDTGYLAFCAGLDDGRQRVANLVDLHERARQFGTFNRQGLRRFLQFIDGLRAESDLGQPSISSGADDVVRVMSIHKSKGLEFPVVFLPDLAKTVNLRDCTGDILVDRQAYVGMTVADGEKRARYPSLASVLVAARIRQQSMAEELRVLYVAMTRAREHLILVGTCDEKTSDKWKSQWSRHQGALPADVVQGARSMLDWIGPVSAALAGGGNPGIELTHHANSEITQWPALSKKDHALTPAQQAMAELLPLPDAPENDPLADQIVARITGGYPHHALAGMAATRSVTSLSKEGTPLPVGFDLQHDPRRNDEERDSDTGDFERLLAPPRFLATESAQSATERGVATHLLLQHLRFDHTDGEPDIRAQLDDLVHRLLMTEAQAASIDIESILWLMNTDVGQLMRRNPRSVRRELPIYLTRPPLDGDTPLHAPASMDQIMIRGRIDALIDRPEGLIVIDYKTDHVVSGALDRRRDFYLPQVGLYRDAIRTITRREVTDVYLAFLTPREILRM